MPNAVLERLETQRAEQISFIDNLLNRVDAEGRDLTDSEQANLTATRQRVGEIDAQLAPLREFEELRGASADGLRRAVGADPAGDPRPLGAGGGAGAKFAYRSAGAWMVDYLRAHDVKVPDAAALARLEGAARQLAAIQNQITTDTPGLLPTPVVGPVVDTLDGSRPFIASIGAKPLAGIAGTGFSRPKITQHVQVGAQTAEKTDLPSRKMVISSVPFAKGTYGGTVNISRQDIDWTSPSAWDALVTDLAKVYGGETENVAADAFAAGVTQTATVDADTLEGWALALYNAAVLAYRGGAPAGAMANGSLPNRVWVSLDMWAKMGSIVDVARLTWGSGTLGDNGGIADFAGDILNAPRVVVPAFPASTVIVGSPVGFEFYEDQIGLLSAVEPKILGVEVAYGGYVAYGFVEALGFAKLTPPAAPLTTTARKRAASSDATSSDATSSDATSSDATGSDTTSK
jgi:hypothetical protein